MKNPNKNPVAERAVQELEDELLRQEPSGGSVSSLSLAIATARLNSRIRYSGLSARELWTQRSQFTHEQLPVSDRSNLLKQQKLREQNHPSSETSKHKSGKPARSYPIDIGDLVYLYADRDKSKARNRYLVVSTDGEWCFIKKFSGSQLRSSSYKVKRDECYLVPTESLSSRPFLRNDPLTDNEDEDILTDTHPPPPVAIPETLTAPGVSLPVQSENPASPVEYDHPIIIASPVDNSTDCQPAHDSSPSEITQMSAPSVSRPKREIKRPKYLDDYVLK